MLAEYFKPLSPFLLVLTIISLLYFDVIGAFVDRFINSPKYMRPVIWVYGIGVVVVVWFFLRFFVPLSQKYVFISLVIPFTVCISYYAKNKHWQSLLLFVKSNLTPLFVLALLMPVILVKSSLPPYLTDEMQYHFFSPYEVNNKLWEKSYLSVHPNLPKEMDLFFAIPFAFTKTYSVSRLLHFLIYYTGIWAIYAWFKEKTNAISAIAFLFTSVFIYHDMPIVATSGYIDYSTASLTMLSTISMIDALLKRNIKLLYPALSIGALSVGSKYPSLVPFFASIAVLAFVMAFLKIKVFRGVFNKFFVLKSLALIIFFGGYWYIYNFVRTGNPIFPFMGNLFKCKEELCAVTSGIFGTTTPITIGNLPQIIIGITKGHSIYFAFIIPAIVFSIVKKDQNKITLQIYIVIFSILSLLLTGLFTGFVDRYFYFLQICLALIICVPFSVKFSSLKISKIHNLYLLCLFIISFSVFTTSLRKIYSIKTYVSPQEIRYAVGKTTIIDWINDRHKATGNIYLWCGQSGKKTLNFLDYDLLRKADDGWTHVFNINCNLSVVKEGDITKGLIPHLTDSDKVYFALEGSCDSTTKDFKLKNYILCNSKRLTKHVYAIDIKKLTASVQNR